MDFNKMSPENRSKALTLAILSLVLLVPAIIYDGAVLLLLWRWFVVPLGVIPLTLPIACGLMLVAHSLVGKQDMLAEYKLERDEDFVVYNIKTRLSNMFTMPTFLWIFGWIIHLFMPVAQAVAEK